MVVKIMKSHIAMDLMSQRTQMSHLSHLAHMGHTTQMPHTENRWGPSS